MDATASPHDALSPALPAGYRARSFGEEDREPLVADRNAEVHEMQQVDADEWRAWERIDPPRDELRLTVVASDGTVAASANVGPRRMGEDPKGRLQGGVGVLRAHRRQGIGTTLLRVIEDEARRRGAPRLLGGASAGMPGAVEWATARGYREIGRRIESYVPVGAFDPGPFADLLRRLSAAGIRLRTVAEVLDGQGEGGREAFWRALYEAEGPIWEDVPWAAPTPHWDYGRFHRLAVESGRLVPEASIVAFDGNRVAGFTMTGRQKDRGHTWMTGTDRAYRGRGVATALKVEMLRRAPEAGLVAMLTTNDEPNKAMRGINARLGYVMLPAHVQLEKTL